MTYSEFVSITQAARILGVSRQAVYKKVKSGKLPSIKIGNTYAIPREHIVTGAKIKNIKGGPLKKKVKDEIIKAALKTFKEYGEVLRKLGNE